MPMIAALFMTGVFAGCSNNDNNTKGADDKGNGDEAVDDEMGIQYSKRWSMHVIAALFMSGVFAGCSNNDNNTNGADDNGNGDEDVSGEMEIQYFVGGYGDEWWKEVISDFEEEYPDVEVKQSAG